MRAAHTKGLIVINHRGEEHFIGIEEAQNLRDGLNKAIENCIKFECKSASPLVRVGVENG